MSLMILCTLLMAACGGKKAQGESVNADSDSIAERQQYRFECQFIKAENEEYDSIVVKGYKDGKVAFECRHQLIDYVSAENAAGMPWINDTVDINFDGIPDLEVYLGCYTRGQVAELYAGYVWTPQQKFEEVEEWKDLFNPEIHPEDKTVTANYRSDANESPEEQEMDEVSVFVEEFYKEWDKRDLLDYGFVKQHITPNLLKYLADEYDYDCEDECLATWKFFYEGGGDVSGLKSRQITARDGNHVLVENNYENYEYDVLLTLVKDGDTFKIDSLKQEKSEYK